MVFESFMPAFWADPAGNPPSRRIHPSLTSFYNEICGTLARLFAYAGTLALLGILALYGWRQLPLADLLEPAAEPGWIVTSRLLPAFAGTGRRSSTAGVRWSRRSGRGCRNRASALCEESR